MNSVAELLRGGKGEVKGLRGYGSDSQIAIFLSAALLSLSALLSLPALYGHQREGDLSASVDWQCMSEFLALIQHTHTHIQAHTHTCVHCTYTYINILLHLYELIIKFQ